MILINPRSTKFGIFDRYVPLSVPVGIGYLAGYLLSRGKKVRVIDEHITPISQSLLEKHTSRFNPPYIFGISSLTACIGRSHEIAHLIKAIYPDSNIILGGIHPTVLAQEVLQDDNIDFVVRNEGEEVLNELYERIAGRGDYSKLHGISFRAPGGVRHNPAAALPDVKKIPPFPYHIFEKYIGRYNFGFIASSRGCPYGCIFCSQRLVSGRNFRYLSADRVVYEIELLINRYGQRHINFFDDTFTADKERVFELCERIIAKGFHKKTTFDCQTRADTVDEDILRVLKKAGFRLINFGLETASERLMVLLNKRETVAENIEAVRLAKRYGFGVSGTFIFGLPTETRKERWQSYRLAKDLRLDYVRFNNATPYPGTRLYEMAKEEGRLNTGREWENLNACGSIVQESLNGSGLSYLPAGCDEEALKRDTVKANLLFSLRPGRVLRLLIKRVGPAGWFYLSPKWYIRPGEWVSLIRLGMRLFRLLLKSFLWRWKG